MAKQTVLGHTPRGYCVYITNNFNNLGTVGIHTIDY